MEGEEEEKELDCGVKHFWVLIFLVALFDEVCFLTILYFLVNEG